MQDAIASRLLEELKEEKQWDDTFAQSQDILAQLAAEAMAEYRAGQTQILYPDKLCFLRDAS